MKQEKIIDGNKIIAEFMGDDVPCEFPYGFGGKTIVHYMHPSKVKNWAKVKLYYHSSWNALMPVVQKIISMITVDDRYMEIVNIEIFQDINRVFDAVVDYICTKNIK
jgi:hypothetical protein